MNEHVTFQVERGPNQAAREWAARLLVRICGFPFRIQAVAPGESAGAQPSVYYGRAAQAAGVTIIPSAYFDGDILTAAAPSPFGGGIERCEKTAVISTDIPASAFWLANRVEEAAATAHDEHGRFPAKDSYMAKHGVMQEPIVDQLALALRHELERLYPGLRKRRPWPAGDFAVCITHDIERLIPIRRLGYAKSRLAAAARSISAGRVRTAGRSLVAGALRAVTGSMPSWTFDQLRRGERPFPGSYYFFGGTTSPRDGQYNATDPRIRQVVSQLAEEGMEIGVHLGYETGTDVESMRLQKSVVEEALGAPAAGVRHHYMRARFPEGWKAHEAAGFEYDCSLGWHDRLGFRGATSFPYRPFDAAAGKELSLYEAPLAAMDAACLACRGLSAEKTVEEIMAVAENVKAVGGMFMLLWHNTMVDPFDKAEERRAYIEVARRLRQPPAWGATVSQCLRAWRLYSDSLEAQRENAPKPERK